MVCTCQKKKSARGGPEEQGFAALIPLVASVATQLINKKNEKKSDGGSSGNTIIQSLLSALLGGAAGGPLEDAQAERDRLLALLTICQLAQATGSKKKSDKGKGLDIAAIAPHVPALVTALGSLLGDGNPTAAATVSKDTASTKELVTSEGVLDKLAKILSPSTLPLARNAKVESKSGSTIGLSGLPVPGGIY